MSKHTVANIASYSMIGSGVAQVVAQTMKVETAGDYASKILDRFDGRLEVVPNSVRNISRGETAKAVAFHVRAVNESMPYTEEAVAQMRTVVEANVFADAEDATWQVVEASGVKRLVKKSDTDVSALLAAAARLNIGRIAASQFDGGVGAVNAGEFAIFTNPETAQVDSGVVFYADNGDLQVLSRATGALVTASHEAIVAHSEFAMEAEEGDNVETAAEFTKRDAKPLVDYFRKLYASQPGFFAQLEGMIRKRFVLA